MTDRPGLHVVAIAYRVDPDGGSEPLIGWNTVASLCDKVARVTLVSPEPVVEALSRDARLPQNLSLVGVDEREVRSRLPIPSNYRLFAGFLENASDVVAKIGADVAHQVNWGTPFWGSALGSFPGARTLGPVGISGPIPSWAYLALTSETRKFELTRRALMRWPGRPVSGLVSIGAAHHVFAVDRRAAAMCRKAGTDWSAMLQDGATPVACRGLVPESRRSDLFWVGRMRQRKAAPLAVRAFAAALPRIPANVRLVMAGSGEDVEEVKRLGHELRLGRRLELLGPISHKHVRMHLASSRALIFTSLRDTFGGVVLEAAEVGTPTVTALHSGVEGLGLWLPRMAMWGGKAHSIGSFVATLADGMVAASNADGDAWNVRSQAAYDFAKDHSWDRRADRMVLRYHRLLAQTP